MAQIFSESESRGFNEKYRHIGCIELPGDINQMLRSEAIINIKKHLENRGWVNVNDFDQGEDQHVFIFELPKSGMSIFPEKPQDDWTSVIEPYRSLYLEFDREVNINN